MKKEIDNVNRRKFLEHSAKITAAGFLMNKLPARSKRLFSIEGEIKVALIGCGGRGTGAASQALEADPDVRLVAVADVFEDRITECLKSLNEKYPDSERMIAGRKLYTWNSSRLFAIDGNLVDLYCIITVEVNSNEKIVNWQYDGNNGGCRGFANRLKN